MATREEKARARRMAHDLVWKICDMLAGSIPVELDGDSDCTAAYQSELDKIAEQHAEKGQLVKE